MITESQKTLVKGLLKPFKLNDQPVDLSEGQMEIFAQVIQPDLPRVHIIAPSQYGKSMTLGLGTLTAATQFNDRWTICAPSEKKAKIIMGHVIDHAFDHPMFYDRLELDASISLDRLRRERSRENVTFKGGGGVQVLTLDARNTKRSTEAAMGFGSKKVLLDESCLIDDLTYATVKRMLGGFNYWDTTLIEIGNPFYRNHFFRTSKDPRYHKIFIDYIQALKEGRFSPEFIDEMRDEAFFDVLYECLFPQEDMIDERGYRRLMTIEQVEALMVREYQISEEDGKMRLGIDVGGGGDLNVYCLRNQRAAWIESTNRSNDTMTNVTEAERIVHEYGLSWSDVFIDDIGVGRGVSDRLKEKGHEVHAVTAGAKCNTKAAQGKYKNVKAENYWEARRWMLAGGKLVSNKGFLEIPEVKYKVNSDKVVQIEPKEELKKRIKKSPDHAEAFMLTFTQSIDPSVEWIA